MTTRTLSILALLTTLAATDVMAQGRTLYDTTTGKAATRSVTGSDGTTVTYDASTGKVITREAITRSGTTVYDARTGGTIAKATRKQR